MKSLIWLLAFLAHAALAIETGSDASDFALPDQHGKQIRLSEQRGKVVYLDFWASWCGPCRQSFPWLNEMQSKYGSKGLLVVGLGVDAKKQDAEAFLAAYPVQFAIALDATGATPRAYGIKAMPSSYLIDRDGKLLFQHVGFRPSDKAELEERIRQALAQP